MSTSPPAPRSLRGLVLLLAAVVGVLLMYYSFSAGISAALDGSGSGSLLWQIVFLVAFAVVILAMVFAIINLVRKRSRVLSIITIVVGLIPIGVVIALAVMANAPTPTR